MAAMTGACKRPHDLASQWPIELEVTVIAAVSCRMLTLVKTDRDPLAELEHRQDEALQQLDELERRIEQAIHDFQAVQQATADRFGRKQKAAA